jgi:hypothetical protein
MACSDGAQAESYRVKNDQPDQEESRMKSKLREQHRQRHRSNRA